MDNEDQLPVPQTYIGRTARPIRIDGRLPAHWVLTQCYRVTVNGEAVACLMGDETTGEAIVLRRGSGSRNADWEYIQGVEVRFIPTGMDAVETQGWPVH